MTLTTVIGSVIMWTSFEPALSEPAGVLSATGSQVQSLRVIESKGFLSTHQVKYTMSELQLFASMANDMYCCFPSAFVAEDNCAPRGNAPLDSSGG